MDISERDLKLKEKYPIILQELGGDRIKTCMSAEHGGVAVGDGWIPLLDKLFAYCQHHHDENGYPQLVAEQIKEKFGTLRFYYRFEECTSENAKYGKKFNRTEDYLEGAIGFAEDMTAIICESCGAPAKLSGDRWLSVTCEECKQKLQQ